jgi:transglutaminase-like putative cysteine protease
MRLKISHTTRYVYNEPVHYSLQQVRLTPKSRAGQTVIHWKTEITGGSRQVDFDDQHNNHVMLVSVDSGESEISIHSEGEVETADQNGVVGAHGGYAPLWYFKRATALTTPGPNLRGLVKSLGQDFEGDIQRMHALSNAISKAVTYETGMTQSETTAEEALGNGHGVCQDHAHIFAAAARLMDIPARYVSGYLMMNDRVEQDAGHAWAEAHIPGIGWIGFDVSNDISPDERYVRVATGLDYQEAAPISGMRLGDSVESMFVSLQVQQ